VHFVAAAQPREKIGNTPPGPLAHHPNLKEQRGPPAMPVRDFGRTILRVWARSCHVSCEFFPCFHSNRAPRNGQWYGRQGGTDNLCVTYMQKQLRCLDSETARSQESPEILELAIRPRGMRSVREHTPAERMTLSLLLSLNEGQVQASTRRKRRTAETLRTQRKRRPTAEIACDCLPLPIQCHREILCSMRVAIDSAVGGAFGPGTLDF